VTRSVARFDIDPDRSEVWIEGRSTLHPIHSHTSGLEGYIETNVRADGQLDLTSDAAAHLSLPVDRLRSGNALEERELKRRILASRFPTIDGDLTDLAATAENDRYLVTGTVTFRGESCAFTHEMDISRVDASTMRLSGEATFDVRDFGMEPPKILLLRVEPDVTVRVEIVATEARPAT